VRLLAQLHTHTHTHTCRHQRRSVAHSSGRTGSSGANAHRAVIHQTTRRTVFCSPLAIAIVLCPSAAELAVCVCVGNSERYAMRHLCPRKGCGGYRYAASRSCYYWLAVV
jgi:hypothetical protein